VLIVLAVPGALWLLYELRTVVLLVAFSLLFAYLLAPLVSFIQTHLAFGRVHGGRGRGLAIAITYVVVFGAVALSVAWIAPRVFDQMSQAAKQAPERLESVTANGEPLRSLYGRLERLGSPPALIERGATAITGGIDTGVRAAGATLVHLAAYLPWLVLIPILAFFLLKDAAVLRRGAVELLPAGRPRAHAATLLDRIDAALAAYIRAQLVACLIVGVLAGIGFALLRVPYSATLGIAAGIAEFLPLVGPVVIAVVSAAVAGMHAPMLAVWVLVFLGVLRVIEDYVIYPRLIGSNMHLHPLAVILAVLAGAELGGAVGVVLSVPALAIASAVYRYTTVESSEEETGRPRARPA
jgi:predicted PurR-regulated permease PerM